MVSKTISVSEEVYDRLKQMQLPNESLEETIARLCRAYTAGHLKNWLETTKGWEDMTEEESQEFSKVLKKFRVNFQPFKED